MLCQSLLMSKSYYVADYDGESPHAGVGQSRVEAVAAKVLAQDRLHIDGQLGEQEVEDPVVGKAGHQDGPEWH